MMQKINFQDDEQLKAKEKLVTDTQVTAKLLPTPYVVMKEENNELSYSVMINNFEAVVESLERAVDICFKLIKALQVDYSPINAVVWQFIEKYFYDFEVGDNIEYHSVRDLQRKISLLNST